MSYSKADEVFCQRIFNTTATNYCLHSTTIEEGIPTNSIWLHNHRRQKLRLAQTTQPSCARSQRRPHRRQHVQPSTRILHENSEQAAHPLYYRMEPLTVCLREHIPDLFFDVYLTIFVLTLYLCKNVLMGIKIQITWFYD